MDKHGELTLPLLAVLLGVGVEKLPELLGGYGGMRRAEGRGEDPTKGLIAGMGGTYAGSRAGAKLGDILGMPVGALLGAGGGGAMGGNKGALIGALIGALAGKLGGEPLGRTVGGMTGYHQATKYRSGGEEKTAGLGEFAVRGLERAAPALQRFNSSMFRGMVDRPRTIGAGFHGVAGGLLGAAAGGIHGLVSPNEGQGRISSALGGAAKGGLLGAGAGAAVGAVRGGRMGRSLRDQGFQTGDQLHDFLAKDPNFAQGLHMPQKQAMVHGFIDTFFKRVDIRKEA